jgi:hypothetical protein
MSCLALISEWNVSRHIRMIEAYDWLLFNISSHTLVYIYIYTNRVSSIIYRVAAIIN